jgi:hypothetical protein
VTTPLERAWARRPATAVSRLGGRELVVLSMREILAAATRGQFLLVALVAPAPAALHGFARAARDAEAPLLLVRPSGAADELGPEEAREDTAFVQTAFMAADELKVASPMALLKDPPRVGGAVPDRERVRREIEAGFTSVSLAAADTQAQARDAALAATLVCQLELGLEVVPLGGALSAAELARQLCSRGAVPSAVRITGMEDEGREIGPEMQPGTALSSASEALAADLLDLGIQQLVASGPFLRALKRAAPAETWTQLESWADEKGATLEQAAARHQRLLRELPAPAQQRLEALCCFEALELYRKAGARRTGPRLLEASAALHEGED